MADKQLVQELKATANMYVALGNADRELAMLRIEHKNNPLLPQDLQQRVAAIGRKLEGNLELNKAVFIEGSEQQRLTQAMVNSIQSFQRYAVSKIPTDKSTTSSPTLTSSSIRPSL